MTAELCYSPCHAWTVATTFFNHGSSWLLKLTNGHRPPAKGRQRMICPGTGIVLFTCVGRQAGYGIWWHGTTLASWLEMAFKLTNASIIFPLSRATDRVCKIELGCFTANSIPWAHSRNFEACPPATILFLTTWLGRRNRVELQRHPVVGTMAWLQVHKICQVLQCLDWRPWLTCMFRLQTAYFTKRNQDYRYLVFCTELLSKACQNPVSIG